METKKYLVYDAFTEEKYAGNPCAIVPDAKGLTDKQMQMIAKEVNLPETSFVFPSEKADFKVRYFTPRYEIGFAGHPTIATAVMLGQEGMIQLDKELTTIRLEFNIGVLPVDIHKREGKSLQAVMTQSEPFFGEKVSYDEMAQCFKGFVPDDFYQNALPQIVGTGANFLIVPINDFKKLEKIEMNREKLAEVTERLGVNAAYVFTTSGFAADTGMHGRLCDPCGSFEDPFTGSAVGAAGAYVIHYGLTKSSEISVEQGHFIGRPGFGKLSIQHDNGKIQTIKLGGAGVKVIEGVIRI